MNEIDILEQKAVDAAVNSKWTLAVELNNQILRHDEKNVTAQLRLGFAYMQLKQFIKAKTHYQHALKLQPSNIIAIENLEKLKMLNSKAAKDKKTVVNINPNLFLEIAGRTKSIALVNIGQRGVLASLVVGQEVKIKPKRRKIEIRTAQDEYVGTLPDDISRRLLVFIESESEYEAYIKEATLTRVVVFIKEIKKGARLANHISFTQTIQPEPNGNEKDDDGEDNDEGDDKDHIEVMAEALDKEPEENLGFQTSEEEEESEE